MGSTVGTGRASHAGKATGQRRTMATNDGVGRRDRTVEKARAKHARRATTNDGDERWGRPKRAVGPKWSDGNRTRSNGGREDARPAERRNAVVGNRVHNYKWSPPTFAVNEVVVHCKQMIHPRRLVRRMFLVCLITASAPHVWSIRAPPAPHPHPVGPSRPVPRGLCPDSPVVLLLSVEVSLYLCVRAAPNMPPS